MSSNPFPVANRAQQAKLSALAAIVAEAERVGAGVLAFATHGQSGLRGMWAGSVGAKLLAQFHRPLLLVPVAGSGAVSHG